MNTAVKTRELLDSFIIAFIKKQFKLSDVHGFRIFFYFCMSRANCSQFCLGLYLIKSDGSPVCSDACFPVWKSRVGASPGDKAF